MMKQKTEKEIYKLMYERKKENAERIKETEKLLIRMRGYIFKMPRPGTSVAISISGGSDSIITTAILLKKYKLRVYPFFIQRGQRAEKYELESLKFFSSLFHKEFPHLYHSPTILSVPNPASEIKHLLTDQIIRDVGYPMRNSILLEYGVQVAFALSTKNAIIRDVFCSFVALDGDFAAQTTLATLRSLMYHVCVDMNDMRWQITALPIEKELGFYLNKKDLFLWAQSINLPIEKTRSCFENQQLHCGVCHGCGHRKRGFQEAGIADKTIYRGIHKKWWSFF